MAQEGEFEVESHLAEVGGSGLSLTGSNLRELACHLRLSFLILKMGGNSSNLTGSL